MKELLHVSLSSTPVGPAVLLGTAAGSSSSIGAMPLGTALWAAEDSTWLFS